jgi:transglutaminase-like putative cysteine protease
MYVAPHVTLSGCLHPIPDGVAGIHVTLRAMRELVRQWRTSPDLISAARSIVFLELAKDEVSEARTLFQFVRDRVRYVRDVLDVETLSNPMLTLRTRSGDCDDQSTLLATLYEAIGFPTRFVVAGYTLPHIYEHVYLQVFVDGEWVSCDPTESEPFGWEPSDAVSMMIEGVA